MRVERERERDLRGYITGEWAEFHIMPWWQADQNSEINIFPFHFDIYFIIIPL